VDCIGEVTIGERRKREKRKGMERKEEGGSLIRNHSLLFT